MGTCSYNDQYMSLDSGNKGYIGGKSVVIHQSDDTAFACAKYFLLAGEGLKVVSLRSARRKRFPCPIVVMLYRRRVQRVIRRVQSRMWRVLRLRRVRPAIDFLHL